MLYELDKHASLSWINIDVIFAIKITLIEICDEWYARAHLTRSKENIHKSKKKGFMSLEMIIYGI